MCSLHSNRSIQPPPPSPLPHGYKHVISTQLQKLISHYFSVIVREGNCNNHNGVIALGLMLLPGRTEGVQIYAPSCTHIHLLNHAPSSTRVHLLYTFSCILSLVTPSLRSPISSPSSLLTLVLSLTPSTHTSSTLTSFHFLTFSSRLCYVLCVIDSCVMASVLIFQELSESTSADSNPTPSTTTGLGASNSTILDHSSTSPGPGASPGLGPDASTSPGASPSPVVNPNSSTSLGVKPRVHALVGWVGDCKVVLSEHMGQATCLTTDHKPDDPVESARIEKGKHWFIDN